ncbi:MAG: hypothetical protein GY870_13245 [archaeon]|nr:hypothetical protein [archaeon]
MQSPIRTSLSETSFSHLKIPKIQNYPLGIEEFIQNMDDLKEFGYKYNITPKSLPKYENTQIKYAKKEDAQIITNIHNKVYEGHYPYHEMLDKDYVEKQISNKKKKTFCIYNNIIRNTPAGCFITEKNTKLKSGYMRGLMVLPDHREEVNYLKGIEFAKEICEKEKKTIEKWYSESRTAHSAAQHFFSLCGHRICAIFPNKDIFFGGTQRESDALTIGYSNKALYNLRNSKPELLPIFSDLFDYMRNIFSLSEPCLIDSSLNIDYKFLKGAEKIAEQIVVIKYEGEYNTNYYRLKTKFGSTMKFLVTKTVKSAEKTEIFAKNPLELAGLLLKLEEIINKDEIDYFECYFPANNVEFQEVFLNFGFSVFGYVPAWLKNMDDTLDDCIVFGKYKMDLNSEELKLLPLGFELLEVLKQFLH